MADDIEEANVTFLKGNVSTFVSSTDDMKIIDPYITNHELNIDPSFKHIKQKEEENLDCREKKQSMMNSAD